METKLQFKSTTIVYQYCKGSVDYNFYFIPFSRRESFSCVGLKNADEIVAQGGIFEQIKHETQFSCLRKLCCFV